MKVSVVVCTHKLDRLHDLKEAIESLLNQDYNDLEIILVVDGNKKLYEIAREELDVDVLLLNRENLGLSESRNRGIMAAHGDIIAFFDDDAIADKHWIKELVRMYEEKDAIAVGGKILPLWIGKKPRYLPEELYWLIGVTHRGFPEEVTEVRNTFGSNLSFKTEILKALGGFRQYLGVKGTKQLQGEETELCERMRRCFGRGVIYNPNAIVYHKIYLEKLTVRFLLNRIFWQGYSKRVLEELGCSLEEEKEFAKNIITNAILKRLKKPSVDSWKQNLFLVSCIFVAGIGYASRLLRVLYKEAEK